MSSPGFALFIEAVLNGIWQTVALSATAGLLLKTLSRSTAGMRYLVWYAVLLAGLVLPVAHIVIRRPAELTAPSTPEVSGPALAEDVSPSSVESPLGPVQVQSGWLVRGVTAAWIVGAFVLLGRLGYGIYLLRKLKLQSEPPPLALRQWSDKWTRQDPGIRPTTVAVSSGIRLPVTAGLSAPTILFPSPLVSSLTEEDAHDIWLHEISHVRRLDDWMKLLQRVIESILFLNPILRWVGGQVDLEREVACDEWVVRRTREPHRYAKCLASLAEFAVGDRGASLPAVSMAECKKQIFRRVEMLLNSSRRIEKTRHRVAGYVVLLVLTVTAVWLALATPIFVLAQEPPTAPMPPSVIEPPSPPAVAPVPPQPPRPGVVLASPPFPTMPLQPGAPPMPPVPPVQANPDAEPVPAIDAAAAQVRAMREAMRAGRAEIRKFAREIERGMRDQGRTESEGVRKLTEELRLRAEQQLRALREQSHQLARQLRNQSRADGPDVETIQKLQQQIEQVHEKVMIGANAEIRALQEKIRTQQLDMGPSEEQFQKMNDLLRKHQDRLQDMRERLHETVEELMRREETGELPMI